ASAIVTSIYTRMRLRGVMFFFFSSRRRHTRSYGDWSSDVCSSDLKGRANMLPKNNTAVQSPRLVLGTPELASAYVMNANVISQRSEERRVGKECRSRRSP